MPVGVAGQLVRGQVVDSISGSPVAGAMVFLSDADGTEAERTVSDTRGHFLLRAPAAGNYRLIAAHTGYRQAAFPVFALDTESMQSFVLLLPSVGAGALLPDGETQALAAALCPAGVADGDPVIVGTVFDAGTGEPVPDARVHLSMPIGPAADSAPPDAGGVVESDADGRFAVCNARFMSRVAMHAIADDRISAFEAVLFGTGGAFARDAFLPLTQPIWRQDLTVFSRSARAAAVTGTVLDTAGSALSGVSVEIVGTPHQAHTDEEGRFTIANLAGGDVRLLARRVGYSPAEYDLDLMPGETVAVPDSMLVLGQFSSRLRDIIVTGQAGQYNPRLDGFYERRSTSPRGKFVTPEDWQNWLHYNVDDVLTRSRYMLESPSKMICDAPPVFFLDGVFVQTTSVGLEIDDVLDVSWLAAIEAYGSGFDAPVRYRRKGCAPVVLLWSEQHD
jgi:protocatechuate 3,4-dioxygenase beta subunit